MPDCLGISALGQCGYDPANPTISYFSIGEVVAALSITLALPQFLKPVYQFRLRAQSLGLTHIYATVFVASASVLFAAILPQLGLAGRNPIAYPILWELLAGCLFFVAFAVLAWTTLRPPTVRRHRVKAFVQAAADFLAHANDADRTDFAQDLRHNLGRLAEASEWMERSRDQSAFFDFIHRRDIEDGEYAAAFFRLIAEPQFCAILVCRSPWDTAGMLGELSKRPRVGRSDIGFVQELGRQAIISPRSMMAREIGYTGFVAAPVLSDALFHDPYIGRHYHPLHGLHFDDFLGVNADMVERYFHAVAATLENILNRHDYWGDRSLSRLADNVQWLGYDIRKQTRKNRRKYNLTISLKYGLEELIRQVRNELAADDNRVYERLFARDSTEQRRDYSIVDGIAEAIVNVMGSFANDFEGGPEDPFWSTAHQLFHAVFDVYGDVPDGMDPLQQRVAIKMIKKVNDNMNGLYPALTRVLLPVIGPYDSRMKINPKSAYALFKEAFYSELKRLPELHKKHPEKVAHYISGGRYDAETEVVIRVYADGKEVSTDLRSLEPEPVSFTDPSIQRRGQVNAGAPVVGGREAVPV